MSQAPIRKWIAQTGKIGIETGILSGINPGDGGAAPVVRTDVSFTVLTSGSNTTDATSFNTASITPTANKLIIGAVLAAAAGTVAPTMTGNGLTWTQQSTVQFVSNARRITVFRAIGATPTAGAVTIDWAAQTQTSAAWIFLEVTGCATSGTNGADAFVQAVTGQVGPAVTTIQTVLAAFENAKNRALVYVGRDGSSASGNTPDADFVELADVQVATGNCILNVQHAANTLVCDTTFVSASAGTIGLEIKAGTA